MIACSKTKMFSPTFLNDVASKGFWGELLGVGNFYYELGVQVIEACMAMREETGGLIELDLLKQRLMRIRSTYDIRPKYRL